MDAWEIEGRGGVVLPTGSGKNRVAIAALARVQAPRDRLNSSPR